MGPSCAHNAERADFDSFIDTERSFALLRCQCGGVRGRLMALEASHGVLRTRDVKKDCLLAFTV